MRASHIEHKLFVKIGCLIIGTSMQIDDSVLVYETNKYTGQGNKRYFNSFLFTMTQVC